MDKILLIIRRMAFMLMIVGTIEIIVAGYNKAFKDASYEITEQTYALIGIGVATELLIRILYMLEAITI